VVGTPALSGALFGGLVALALAAAPAQPLIAFGGCRDGQPNGLYELRTPENRLRIVGAFAVGRRTGTFVFWDARGARIAVIPYDNDVKSGTVAVWYDPAHAKADPPRKSETAYVRGELHGVKRSWHPNGRPRTEFRYEHGVLVEARAWSAGGVALSAGRARELAEQDVVADDIFYETLEASIAANLPQCPASPGKGKP
jgi:hypothetical protein